MSDILAEACLAEFGRICPAGFAVVVNLGKFEYDWVEFRYPQAWVERYVQGEYILEDPTLAFAKDRTGHVTWDDLRKEFPGNRVMDEAAEFGLHDGNTLVVNIGGILSVASGAGRIWTPEEVKVLTTALTALHSLFAKPAGPSLDAKQIEVLRLMAQGFRDAEIAEELGIKPVSVRTRRAAAQAATATKTPAQLVAWAVRAQLI